jgi:FtsH-binding integral membrane protein
MIFNNSLVLLNEKKEPSFLGKIIMGLIIAIIIFIF